MYRCLPRALSALMSLSPCALLAALASFGVLSFSAQVRAQGDPYCDIAQNTTSTQGFRCRGVRVLPNAGNATVWSVEGGYYDLYNAGVSVREANSHWYMHAGHIDAPTSDIMIATGSDGSTAHLSQTGGLITARSLYVPHNTTARGYATISGGEMNLVGSTESRVYLSCQTSNTARLTLSGGILGASDVLCNGAGTFASAEVIFNGGTLRAGPRDSDDWIRLKYAGTSGPRNVLVQQGGARFDTNGRTMRLQEPLQHSGTAAIDGGLVKLGAGTLILSGANTYTGHTSINAGVLEIAAPEHLGAGGGIGLYGGMLRITGTAMSSLGTRALDPSYVAGGIDVADAGHTFTLPGNLGNGNLTAFTKNGAGTLVLSGSNTWTGGTTVNGGTLRLTAGGESGALRKALVVNNARVESTVEHALGYGALKVDSVTLNGATFDHMAPGGNGRGVGWTLNGGTMRSNGGVSSTTAASRITLGNHSWVRKIGVSNSFIEGRIDLDPEGDPNTDFDVEQEWLHVTAGISSQSGAAGLTKKGGGYLLLRSANTFGGPAVVQGGELAAMHPLALQNSTVVTDSAAGQVAFRGIDQAVFGGLSGSRAVMLNNTDGVPVTLSVGNNNQHTTYSGAFGGSGALIKIGSGTWTLSGASSHTATTVNGGTLIVAAGGGTGPLRGALVVNPGATLRTTSGDALGYVSGQKIDAITINGGTLDNASSGNVGWGVTYTLQGGTLRSNAGIASTTAGSSFSFGGASGFTTSVIATSPAVSTIAGHVSLRPDNGNTAMNFSVADGAVLDIPAGLSGGGTTPMNIVKLGGGRMTLGFAGNSYTGATLVQAGTLHVTGSTGSGGVTVAAGATLSGDGRIAGPAHSQAGGVIAPGAAIGTLTFTQGLALAANSRLAYELGAVANSDRVRVSGGSFAAPVSGTVTIDVGAMAGFGPGSYLLVDHAGAAPESVDLADFSLGARPPGPYTFALRLQGTSLWLDVQEIDTTPPAITSIGVPADATYAIGQSLDFIVNFNEPVQVSGALRLRLILGGITAYANYVSGSGSSSLLLRYTVPFGHYDEDGIALASALDPNGGTLADAAGNAALLALNGVPSTAGIRIDGLAPRVVAIRLLGMPPSSSTQVDFEVEFSEPVTGVDAGDFNLVVVSGDVTARIAQSVGSDKIYTVTVDRIGGVGRLRIDPRVTGTGIQDAVGNGFVTAFTGGEIFDAQTQRRCHVDQAASGANDGSGWAHAFVELQSALRDAGCTEIWVARGVYTPGSTRADTFALRAGAKLHGGFAGNETTLAQRTLDDIAANRSVLSGDIERNDATDAHGILLDSQQIVGGNSQQVLSLIGTPDRPIGADTMIDGFAITGGQATTGSFRYGGGVRCEAALQDATCSPTLADLLFSGNAAEVGAGMAISTTRGVSEAQLSRITFRGNRASVSGGGLSVASGFAGSRSAPVLRNVTFIGNHATNEAGAIAGHSSGGQVEVVIANGSFTDNHSPGRGGALSVAGYQGGTVRAQVSNSILWGNSTPEIYNQFDGSATLSHSLVQGGCPAGNTCTDAVSGDPLLGTLNHHGGAVPVLMPGVGSGAIDSGSCMLPEDARGRSRPQGSACDLGAVELRQTRLQVQVTGEGTVSAAATPVPVQGAVTQCSQGGGGGGGCVAHYRVEPSAPQILLSATAADGWHATGWSGGCAADGSVGLDTDRTCGMEFARNLVATTLVRDGGGTVTYGDEVTLVATVNPMAPATAVPGGSVSFHDGATLLGIAPLDAAGVARFSTRLLPAGARSLTARHDGDAVYLAPQTASAPLPLSVAPALLHYVATPVTLAYGAAPEALGGDVTGFVNGETLSTATTGSLLFSTSAVAGSPVGRYPITGDGLAADNYSFGQAPDNAQALTIEAVAQVLSFASAPSVVVGGSGQVVASNVGIHSSQPIVYSTTSSTCSVDANDGLVTGVAAGGCTIRATQAGDGNHLAGEATLDLVIGRGAGNVVFDTLAFVYNGTPHAVTAYLLQEPSAACVVSGSPIGPDAGDHDVSAVCEGDDYVASAQATATIFRAPGTVTFGPLQFTYTGSPHAVSAQLAEEPAANCVIAGAPVGPEAGEHPVHASCAGTNFVAEGAATAVIAKATGTVVFDTLQFSYDGNTHAVAARMVEDASAICVIDAAPVGPAAGEYAVEAHCEGSNHRASGAGVAVILRASQSLQFPPQTIASREFASGANFPIAPLADAEGPASSQPIRYGSDDGGICSVSGTTVTMHAPGPCVLTADRDGDGNFEAAARVTSLVELMAPGSADLQVSVSADRSQALAGDIVIWTVLARNDGAADVEGARLSAAASARMSDVVWECVSTTGCPTPAEGEGAIDVALDLAAGQSTRLDVLGRVSADHGGAGDTGVDVTAAIALPTGSPLVDPEPGNDSDAAGVQIVRPAIFRDGFEPSQ